MSAIAFFDDPFARERGVLVPSAEPCETAPPSGARAVHDDRFGPSLLYAFAAEPGTERFTFDLARTWRQDRVTVVASGDDLHTAVLWRIALASSSDAVAFGPGPSWWSTAPLHAWARFEDEIVLLASDDPTLLESWADAALAACP